MTAPELKPCPFCGAVDPEWLASHVVCDCGATGPRQDVDREYQADAMRALTDWNRRADLAAVQPAQVRVKPLVWEERDAHFHAAQSQIGVYYLTDYKGMVVPFKLECPSQISSRNYTSIDDAKAAAQVDYEARILAALEPQPDQTVEIDLRVAMMEELEKAASESLWVPEEYYMNEVISDCCAFLRSDRSQPDPRDEVIKGLVEAATDAAEAIDMAYGSDDDESPHRHSAKLRAALAAAKEVQK